MELPPVHPGADLLLKTFMDMHAARPSSGFGGLAAIPLSEVIAWQQALNVRLTPWEVETILHLDRAAREALEEK